MICGRDEPQPRSNLCKCLLKLNVPLLLIKITLFHSRVMLALSFVAIATTLCVDHCYI